MGNLQINVIVVEQGEAVRRFQELSALPFLELFPQVIQEICAPANGNARQDVEDVFHPKRAVHIHHIGEHVDLAGHGQQNAHRHGHIFRDSEFFALLGPNGLEGVDDSFNEQGNQDDVSNLHHVFSSFYCGRNALSVTGCLPFGPVTNRKPRTWPQGGGSAVLCMVHACGLSAKSRMSFS